MARPTTSDNALASSSQSTRNIRDCTGITESAVSKAPENEKEQPVKKKRGPAKDNSSSGACAHCKSLKVKCHFNEGATRCERCIAGDHECIARTRKKRRPAQTHEDLQARSRQQDLEIQSLLAQFDKLHVDFKASKWLQQAAELRGQDADIVSSKPNVATCHYYSSLIGPLDIDLSPTGEHFARLPLIVRIGIISPPEIIDLFNLYFERINPFFSLLDGDSELHAPQKLIWSSSFLFTVVCACAARHYTRNGLWALAMEIAYEEAASALVTGPKTVETVQAFLILAVYPVPKKKWLDDRSWLFMGAAIRLALELGLNSPQNGPDIRENLNRTRTWINTYCVDGSHATQFGKMPMVKLADYIVRTMARSWYKSLDNSPYDNALCAYSELLMLMARFREAVATQEAIASQHDTALDVVDIAIRYDKDMMALHEYWQRILDADPNVQICPIVRYRCHNFQMIANYLRLVILSVGFQHSLKTLRGLRRGDYVLQQSILVAETAIRTVIDVLYPSSLLGWAMEANFLYMAFCAAFLLNFLRPKFLPLVDPSQCGTITSMVRELIQILSSDAVVLDGRHAPALYSKFLSTLLDKHYTPTLHEQVTSSEIYSQYQDDRTTTPPYVYSWPDVPTTSDLPQPLGDSASIDTGDISLHVVRQQAGDADLDFSLTHFVSSTMPYNPVPDFQQPPLETPAYPYQGLPLYMYNSHQFDPDLPHMPMQYFHPGPSSYDPASGSYYR